MASPIWFPYRTKKGDLHMPELSASLRLANGARSGVCTFLVDTGAALSFAPMIYVERHIDMATVPEVPTPCLDAKGKPMTGRPVLVTVLIDDFPPIEERIYFSSVVPFGLLGQSAFLQRVRAYFFNSLGADRKFGLLAR